MKFADTLNDIMVERGYTKYRVAKLVGVSQSTVSNWLSGKTEPYVREWDRISHALGVSAADLFSGDETKKAPTPQGERQEDERKLSMLVSLFERLSPEDQNDVLYQLLLKAHDQLGQDGHE